MSRRIGFRRARREATRRRSNRVDTRLDDRLRGRASPPGQRPACRRSRTSSPSSAANPRPGTRPTCLAILKLQSFLLPSNWDVELARLQDPARRRAGGDAGAGPGRRTTWPAEPNGPRAGSRHASPLPSRRTGRSINSPPTCAALQSLSPRGGGSNNWVISGSRTQSGKPILASDPHLAPSAPPPWYLMHVRTPEWEAAGAQFVGTPGFAIAHNGFAAWGVTAGLTDNTDLFIETLGADGKASARSRWHIRRVRGGPRSHPRQGPAGRDRGGARHAARPGDLAALSGHSRTPCRCARCGSIRCRSTGSSA